MRNKNDSVLCIKILHTNTNAYIVTENITQHLE